MNIIKKSGELEKHYIEQEKQLKKQFTPLSQKLIIFGTLYYYLISIKIGVFFFNLLLNK